VSVCVCVCVCVCENIKTVFEFSPRDLKHLVGCRSQRVTGFQL
jgi:hypothetical protein